MITIQSAMLVALGVFLAGFAVFLIAPFYRRRAARLATEALKRSMPLTEAEIRADKDRLRAEHAIAIHKLEAKAEEQALSAGRQLVEINRRDAAISALESTTAGMRTALEEHENARRVLEQTITDRLPRVESRLAQAKKQLFQRDQEIATLTLSSGKFSQALDEATQINTQQRDEVHRLNATLTTRAARNREPMGADARFDSEVALRSEIEALRTKTRDQSNLISRLQQARTGAVPGQSAIALASIGSDEEVTHLRASLADAEQALKAARSSAPSGYNGASQTEAEYRSLKSASQDQQAEIARLKALLRAYQAEDADDRAVADSKIAMKARLSALQAQADQHVSTIQSLRSEIAAANEKLARQASQYMDEMRRLGAGTMPASGPGRRESYEQPSMPSLAARINAPRPVASPVSAPPPPPPAPTSNTMPDLRGPGSSSTSPVRPAAAEGARVESAFLRALNGNGSLSSQQVSAAPQSTAPQATAPLSAADQAPVAAAEPADAARANPAQRRPGLLERLTGVDKPAAPGG